MYAEMMDFITTDDVVTFRGDLYKVLKVNPTKYRAVNEAGVVWNLPRSGSVKKVDAHTAGTFKTTLPDFRAGMVVEFTGTAGKKFPGLFVITKADGGRGIFVQLGGGVEVRGGLNSLKPIDEINNFGKE